MNIYTPYAPEEEHLCLLTAEKKSIFPPIASLFVLCVER